MDRIAFRQFAVAAKIGFLDGEEEAVYQNLTQILSSLEGVKNIVFGDEAPIEPLVTVCDLPGVTREDEAQKFIPRDELLQNAVEERNGYFVVPKTLE